MKIILSRKGFDSDFGGIPSPIFPDGSFCSLPIPARDIPNPHTFSQIHFNGSNLGKIVADLSKDKISPSDSTHLDPDLRKDAVSRIDGWLPAFGQVGPAQTHLKKQKVDVGDIFLFFGWFKKVANIDGRWIYAEKGPGAHMLFGWLQIGSILKPSSQTNLIPSWARSHPHVAMPYENWTDNTLYIASESLSFPGISRKIAGGGTFSKYQDTLRLTDPGARTRSVWKLPAWFFPSEDKPPLTYHSNMDRWELGNGSVTLKTVGRGQEFILDTTYYPDAHKWVNNLFD